MTSQLDAGQKHLLRLINRGKKEDGWTSVSAVVFPLLLDLPEDLVEKEKFDIGGGRIRLTEKGNVVLPYIV